MTTPTAPRPAAPWILTLIFAILGGLLSSYSAPKAIAWYFEPPTEIGINCRPATEWAMEKLVYAQAGGILLGGIIGLALVMMIRSRRRAAA
ncbi:MAG: hypothetical protein IT285_08900 [Bdellovibrionales bacterium]|nr:hypothetical protein [Bdellovibrionales bacterium]